MLSTIFIVFVVVILCLGLIIVATSKASEATSVFALIFTYRCSDFRGCNIK